MQVVSALAVGPGAPAGILPFLQHKLLPSEARELIPDPPGGKQRKYRVKTKNVGQQHAAVTWAEGEVSDVVEQAYIHTEEAVRQGLLTGHTQR